MLHRESSLSDQLGGQSVPMFLEILLLEETFQKHPHTLFFTPEENLQFCILLGPMVLLVSYFQRMRECLGSEAVTRKRYYLLLENHNSRYKKGG